MNSSSFMWQMITFEICRLAQLDQQWFCWTLEFSSSWEPSSVECKELKKEVNFDCGFVLSETRTCCAYKSNIVITENVWPEHWSIFSKYKNTCIASLITKISYWLDPFSKSNLLSSEVLTNRSYFSLGKILRLFSFFLALLLFLFDNLCCVIEW